jgi:BirA family biotin operon repressor/biotin-[acetyl-CoA-carboxylase] ligase
MGMNVHGGPPDAAWLDDVAGRRIARAGLLEAWLRSLDRLAADWDGVAIRYRRECATVGRPVRVELSAGEVVTGVAASIDDVGRLVLRADDGTETALSVGDVTHLR